MKRKLTISIGLISTILLLNACSWQVETDQGNNTIVINGNNISIGSGNTVKGDGNIVKREIVIEDYSRINIEGSFDVNYSVSENPFFEITTDENIFEQIDIYVKENTLHIAPQKKTSITPTKLEIRSGSTALSIVNIAGSGGAKIESDLDTERFLVNAAGSGSVENKGVLKTKNLKVVIAGSGNVLLQGEAENADVDVVGSGDADMYNCTVENADCKISGSGSAKLSVTEKLVYQIIGSGNVIYKGEPSIVEGQILGSGSIKKR